MQRPQVEHKRMSLLDQLSYTARIFIKGLKTSVNQRDLINYLRNFGNDNEFSVELTTNKNKKHRGFAFVNITSQKMYNRVIAQDHYIAGAKLEVKDALSKNEIIDEEKKLTEKPRKIFFGGIPQYTTKEELYAYFVKYGEIEDLNLTFKREHRGKGFGFLLFKNGDSMKLVLEDFNKHTIHGSWFECQIAKPKFSENSNGIETEIANENIAQRKQSDSSSHSSKLSILRESFNKNFQQNSKDLSLTNYSNLNTSVHTPKKNSLLDISSDKSQDKLKVNFNLKADLLLEKVDSRSDNATEQKPARSLNTLKIKRSLAKLRSKEGLTQDDWSWNNVGGAMATPQFGNAQVAPTQRQSCFSNFSTQNNVTNYINQHGKSFFAKEANSNFSLTHINAIQAPPGLEPVPRRKSYDISKDMPADLYESLQKQEKILSELEFNKEKMPVKEMEKEIFYNPKDKSQVDIQSLKIFCYDENEVSTRRGSEVSFSDNTPRHYSPNLDKELKDIPYLQNWLDCE